MSARIIDQLEKCIQVIIQLPDFELKAARLIYKLENNLWNALLKYLQPLNI